MRFISTIVLFLISLLSSAVHAKENVVELTDKNFDTKLKSLGNTLVLFYAPWCGYCKRFHPEFDQAALNLHEANVNINLAEIDCDGSGQSTCEKYKVDGYPAVKLFKNGELAESYTGARQAADVIKYAKMAVGQPQSRPIRTFNEFDQLTKENRDPVVMGFFDRKRKDTVDKLNYFLEAGKKWHGQVQFVFTSDEDICKEQGVYSGVVLFRPFYLQNKFEENFATMEKFTSANDLHDFIEVERFGMVGHRKKDNVKAFKRPLVVFYYDVDYLRKAKQTNYYRNRILMVAKKYYQVNFAISNRSEFVDEIKTFEDLVQDNEPPILQQEFVVVALGEYREYKMRENFSMDALARFLDKFLIKENSVQHSAYVKIADVSNFVDMVLKNDWDVVLLIHDSNRFDDIDDFIDLAEILKEEPIDFIKLDMRESDGEAQKAIPAGFELAGNFAVYFLKRDDKTDPILFDEAKLSMEKLMKFVCGLAAQELAHFDREGKLKFVKDEL